MATADPVLNNPNLPASRVAKRRARNEPEPAPPVIDDLEQSPEIVLGADDSYDEPPADEPELAPETSTPPTPAAPLANNAISEKLDRALAAIDALRDENARLRSQKDPTPEAPPTPKKKRLQLEAGADDPAHEQAINEFLGDHKGTIEKLIDKRVAAVIGPVLAQVEQLIDQVEGSVGEVSGVTAETLQRTFSDAIRVKHTDFDTLLKDDKFQAYLKEQAPMMKRGVTVGTVLSQAWKDRDLDVTDEAIKRYKARRQQAQDGKPNPASFVQPSAPRGSTPPPATKPQRQMKQSDWDKLRQQHRRGELSSQEFRQKSAAFLAAAEQGRLIQDVAAQEPATP